MDELDTDRRGSFGLGQFHFAVSLYVLLGLAIAILAAIPEVAGWGEALILMGLSALAILSVLPEISRFRAHRKANRLFLAFVLLQLVSGGVVGSYLIGKIAAYRNDVWVPAGLERSEQLEEIFRMSIGVSEDENLLPVFVWVIAFHGVFISLITGLTYWTTVPAIQLVILGLLWGKQHEIGVLGYAIVFVTIVSIGLEGVLRGSLRAERSGLPASIFRQKAREILLLSLIVMVAAPVMPDLRTLTPIEKVWNLTSPTPSGVARGTLRFSTVFRFVGDLRPDHSPAFRVRASSPQYWRGVAFVNYTGREFLAESPLPEPHTSGETIPTTYSGSVDPPVELVQNFTLLSSFPGVILNAFEPSAVIGVDSFLLTESRVILTEGSQSPGTTYTVVSRIVIPDADTLRSATGSVGYEKYTQIPGSLPDRVRDLAADLTEGLDNSFDQTVAIAQHLKSMRYDLSARQIPFDRDAVDYFLFEMQAGYCQHFAGAMAVLCRAVGIPARVVTGFGSGTYSAADKVYSVLQLSFHAWVEVGFPGFGWVPFDPTPGGIGGPEVVDAAEASTVLGGILPYYGEIQRSPTQTFVTDLPEYVSEDLAFVIEGTVLEGGAEARGVPGVEINVSMDVKGLDIFPAMVMPTDTVPITMLSTRSASDGSFSALCMLPDGVESVTREAKLQVVCLGNEFYESSSRNLTLPLLRRAFLSLRVLGEDRSIVAATLSSSSGPIDNQPLRFFLDGDELGIQYTNGSGTATLLMEVDYGQHVVSARFAGSGALGPAFASQNIPPITSPPADVGQGWLYIVFALPILGVVCLMIFLKRRGDARGQESMTYLYHRMLEVLNRSGIRRRSHMTPFEFADYAESRGAPEGIVRQLTLSFVKEAYAGQPTRTEDLDLARTTLTQLRKSTQGSELRRLRRSVGSVLSRVLQ